MRATTCGARWICTSFAVAAPVPKLSVSIGQTLTQMPQPMQDDARLFSGSCFRAKLITSMPTWQLRVHSMQPMHLSLAEMAKRLMPSLV